MLHDPYAKMENGSIGGEDNLAELQIKSLNELGHTVFDGRVFDGQFKRKKNQLLAQGLGYSQDVVKHIEKFRPDVIHTLNLSQRSGYDWMNQTSIPIVSSIHNFRMFCPSSIAWRDGGPCVECLGRSVLPALRHRCAGRVGAINSARHLIFQKSQPQISKPGLFLLASEMMVGIFETIIPKAKLRILRTPSDTQELERTPKPTRRGWLFAGRFSVEKGILELIKNWPDNELLDLAGGGPLETQIRRMIEGQTNIRLIGTYPPGDRSIFLNYEGLVFPSTWYEGSPLVVMECLGTGTPVICGEISSASEQVKLTDGGVVIQGEFTKTKFAAAFADIRLNFEHYSKSAAINSKQEFSVTSWKLKFEEYLMQAQIK